MNKISLRVDPRYAVHIIEQDDVVVLYNQKRPVILKGADKVSLFKFFEALPGKQILAEDLMSLEESQLRFITELIHAQVIEYLEPS